MQVGIRPAHGDLDDIMEQRQWHGIGDLHAAPDQRLCVMEANFQLIAFASGFSQV